MPRQMTDDCLSSETGHPMQMSDEGRSALVVANDLGPHETSHLLLRIHMIEHHGSDSRSSWLRYRTMSAAWVCAYGGLKRS